MTNYRLTNEGEAVPTTMTGTPLGKQADAPKVRPDPDAPDYTKPLPKDPPLHKGALAVYIDRHGNRFGVDVVRMNNSWATISILRGPSTKGLMIGVERKVSPQRVTEVEPGDVFWWRWPSFENYDYVGKLSAIKAKAGVW